MGVHNGGVPLAMGVYKGSNPSLFGYSFCGPAYSNTRADKLLRMRMIYYACVFFITRATVRLRFPYTDMT